MANTGPASALISQTCRRSCTSSGRERGHYQVDSTLFESDPTAAQPGLPPVVDEALCDPIGGLSCCGTDSSAFHQTIRKSKDRRVSCPSRSVPLIGRSHYDDNAAGGDFWIYNGNAGDSPLAEGSCGFGASETTVHSFTAPLDGDYLIALASPDPKTLFVRESCGVAPTELACDFEFGAEDTNLAINLIEGQTVYIFVDNIFGNEDGYTLSISPFATHQLDSATVYRNEAWARSWSQVWDRGAAELLESGDLNDATETRSISMGLLTHLSEVVSPRRHHPSYLISTSLRGV